MERALDLLCSVCCRASQMSQAGFLPGPLLAGPCECSRLILVLLTVWPTHAWSRVEHLQLPTWASWLPRPATCPMGMAMVACHAGAHCLAPHTFGTRQHSIATLMEAAEHLDRPTCSIQGLCAGVGGVLRRCSLDRQARALSRPCPGRWYSLRACLKA